MLIEASPTENGGWCECWFEKRRLLQSGNDFS